MEKKTIWHTAQEMPEDRPIIEHWKNKLGRNCYNLWYISCAAQLNVNTVRWAYLEDLIATSKRLEELEAEYNEFICNTWVEYADEPDNKLTDDARKLRDRMRSLMNQQILSERDQYKKA